VFGGLEGFGGFPGGDYLGVNAVKAARQLAQAIDVFVSNHKRFAFADQCGQFRNRARAD
jgi:hypothetical protein